MTLTQMLFSFEGRIGRGVYWGISIILSLIAFVTNFVLTMVIEDADEVITIAVVLFILGLYFFVMWISLAISAKRCHDRDKSGWFILISLIPIIGSIWIFIELGCLAGTPGPNQYGESSY